MGARTLNARRLSLGFTEFEPRFILQGPVFFLVAVNRKQQRSKMYFQEFWPDRKQPSGKSLKGLARLRNFRQFQH